MNETLDQLLAELLGTAEAVPTARLATPRERIIQAALELFAEHSYEGATTKAIAERASVTERTLFKHFPSKEELFARTVFPALVQAITPITVQPVAGLLDANTGNFEATVRALVAERVAFAVRHPAIITMAVREGLLRPAFRSAVTTVFNQRVRPQLDALVERARAGGHIRDLPTDVVIRAIIGQIASYVATRLLLAPDAPWDDGGEVGQIVGLIMQGIGTTEVPN